MAITGYGYDGSVTEARWAEFHDLLADPIVSGLAPSVATGTRLITVGTGLGYGGGVTGKNDANVTVTLDANVGSNPRIDVIVMQHDWSGTGGTSTITFVKGTNAANPVAPALTQVPGTLYQVPIGRVTVRPGVGQIAGADLEPCRPLRKKAKTYSTPVVSTTVGTSGTDRQLCTISVPDPGWPYILYCSARASGTNVASGRLQCDIQVNGVQLQQGEGSSGVDGDTTVPGRASDVLTGASTVRLSATSLNLSSSITVGTGRLNVLLVPA